MDKDPAEQLTMDLFRSASAYPGIPGYRKDKPGSGASKLSAANIFDHANGLRCKIARLMLAEYPSGFTSDEAAARIGSTPFGTRPRFSELANAGLIVSSGNLRKSPTSKMQMTVWIASPLLRSAADGRDVA